MLKTIKIIRYLLLLIIIIAFIYYVDNFGQEFSEIRLITLWELMVISILTISGFALNGLLLKIMMSAFRVKLPFIEWFGLTIVNRFANLIITKGGMVLRAAYLKKFHQLSYQHYLIIFLYLSLIKIFLSAAIASAAVVAYMLGHAEWPPNLLVYLMLVVVILLAASISFFFPMMIIPLLPKGFKAKFKGTEQAITNLRGIKLFLIALSFIALFFLLFATKLYYIYIILDYNIDFSSVLIVAASGIISSFATLTPAAIGIREFAMSFSANLYGLDQTAAAVIASLDRIFMLSWSFILSIPFIFLLIKPTSPDRSKKNGKNL